ncbi:hypothetical protein AAG570_013413 [Ranatra chinensis]|uniref:Cirhin n=1 Tax=Ranatra chinensis TaxID=642074 RepID=A0ABD0Z0B6_9HEMI
MASKRRNMFYQNKKRETTEIDMTDSILHLTVSKDGTYTAAADTDSNIVVWSQGEVYAKLPTYKCAPTAMLIQPVTNCLIIVYADHRITEYSLESGCLSDLTESFRKGKLAKTWMSRNFSINGISFDPSRKTAIILHDDSTLYVLTKGKSHRSVDYSTKRAKWEEDYWSSDDSEVQVRDPQPKKIMVNIKIVKKNKHLVHFGSLCKGEMVAVEVGPLSLSEKLPLPSLHQKRFGKM